MDDQKKMIATILAYLKLVWDNRIVVAIGSFVILVFSFYVYYTISQNRIDTLTRQRDELERVVDQQKKAIEQIQKDYTQVIQSKDELTKQIQDTQTEVQELKEKLFRENLGKKPLEELATKKTTLIEKRINKATEDVFRCLELLTQGGDC